MYSNKVKLTSSDILSLQRTLGNRAVTRMLTGDAEDALISSPLSARLESESQSQEDNLLPPQQVPNPQNIIDELTQDYNESDAWKIFYGAKSDQTPDEAKLTGQNKYDSAPRQRHWQGWKLHVTTPPERAAEVASAILPLLIGRNVWHKVSANLQAYSERTGHSQGKFIVIYPKNMTQLTLLTDRIQKIIAELNITQNFNIEGDVPLNESVFARYGVFTTEVKDRLTTLPVYNKENQRVEKKFTPDNLKKMLLDPYTNKLWIYDDRNASTPHSWSEQLLVQMNQERMKRASRLEELKKLAIQKAPLIELQIAQNSNSNGVGISSQRPSPKGGRLVPHR